ncbi:hypothetical protein HDU87_000412 [Geranomyces variabilis]|uniref:Uncharacterized protein n=1 Tax=Geranomyces variabilis TaxID=109894 RepID=A0AAD5TQS7_9FUNG|nr:hypothetical protein HDU87_000412 [Geranomyces variabilis]
MVQATLSWPLDSAQQSLLARLFYHTVSDNSAGDHGVGNPSLEVDGPDACPPPPELTFVLPREYGPPAFIRAISNARKMEVYTQDGDYCGIAEREDHEESLFAHTLNFDDHHQPSSSSYTLKFLLPSGSRNRFLLASVDVFAPLATDHAQPAIPSLASLAGGAGGLDMSNVRKMLNSLDLPVSPAALQVLANIESRQQQQQQRTASALSSAGAAGNAAASMILDANARLQQMDGKIDALQRHFDARFDKLESTLATLIEILSQEQE